MSPLNLSPGARSIACASASASAGVVTPQRSAPVSHSTSTGSVEPGARYGGRQPFDDLARVGHDLDVGAAGERHQAIELGLADRIVGQQDVADAGVDHHFRFAQLLAIDALGAEPDLQMGEFGDLVGLDVRPKAQA